MDGRVLPRIYAMKFRSLRSIALCLNDMGALWNLQNRATSWLHEFPIALSRILPPKLWAVL